MYRDEPNRAAAHQRAQLYADVSVLLATFGMSDDDAAYVADKLWEQGWRPGEDVWDEAYRRGVLDEVGEYEPADNPYRS